MLFLYGCVDVVFAYFVSSVDLTTSGWSRETSWLN